jgi:hypothetical protein
MPHIQELGNWAEKLAISMLSNLWYNGKATSKSFCGYKEGSHYGKKSHALTENSQKRIRFSP